MAEVGVAGDIIIIMTRMKTRLKVRKTDKEGSVGGKSDMERKKPQAILRGEKKYIIADLGFIFKNVKGRKHYLKTKQMKFKMYVGRLGVDL